MRIKRAIVFVVLAALVIGGASTVALMVGYGAGARSIDPTYQYLRGVYDSCITLTYLLTGTPDSSTCGHELQGAIKGGWFDQPSPGFVVPVPAGGGAENF